MTSSWADIWAGRRLDPSRGSVLERLLAADGFDTSFAGLAEDAWRAFVRTTAGRLGLDPPCSVFEVGCGAGAFLYELARRGCTVSGIDLSPALVGYARDAMPGGDFAVGDAASLDPEPQADAVVACGVFLYFPSLEYARTVLERMVAKASRVVAVLDVVDAARAEEALAWRQERAGGAAAYAERYAGLEHLACSREWLAAAMVELGLEDVRVEDQQIAGYGNGRFRFNAWGRLCAGRAQL